ncbi:hypothetical protein Ciccas_012126 [Cichlidogyrus casuarinus]|uniref:Uncharacterized protein n=1 Tax=Cichlidogyrus casuarinus TaxID=1844966 RepID=A0ABD2PPA3_9PLAT
MFVWCLVVLLCIPDSFLLSASSSTGKECGESSHQVKNTTEKIPADLSWDTLIMELLNQESGWEHVFNRRLIDVRDCHESTDYGLKDHHLRSFKKAFSNQFPEYTGGAQKDAHEFLTLFLNEVKRLTPHLKRNAALLGRSYTCPVEEHHVFKMENMRTCKR